MTRFRPAQLLALLAVTSPARASTGSAPAEPVHFVVLGHLRGDRYGPNPKLAELLAEVQGLRPAFVVLTGDLIWGDVQSAVTDTVLIRREWEYLDSALATLGVPVYRVPGNHDISDLASRDVYVRRYGRPPQVVMTHGIRLLLLTSTWIPPDGDTRKKPYTRGVDLDSAQVKWLREELRRDGAPPTFAFLQHLLWWEPDSAPWWRDVHPVLVRARVRAVFSGDYGPLKFSSTTRDGVRYFQSSIEDSVSVAIQRGRISSRVLSSQFDNYLEVVLATDSSIDVRVHTVAEVSSGQFTPERYSLVTRPKPPAPIAQRIWALIGSPKRLGALVLGMLGLVATGYFLGRRGSRSG